VGSFAATPTTRALLLEKSKSRNYNELEAVSLPSNGVMETIRCPSRESNYKGFHMRFVGFKVLSPKAGSKTRMDTMREA
jgi:hypothetical protein